MRQGRNLTAIEVKSQKRPSAFSGMKAFADAFQTTGQLIVGPGGISVEKFLSQAPERWLF